MTSKFFCFKIKWFSENHPPTQISLSVKQQKIRNYPELCRSREVFLKQKQFSFSPDKPNWKSSRTLNLISISLCSTENFFTRSQCRLTFFHRQRSSVFRMTSHPGRVRWAERTEWVAHPIKDHSATRQEKSCNEREFFTHKDRINVTLHQFDGGTTSSQFVASASWEIWWWRLIIQFWLVVCAPLISFRVMKNLENNMYSSELGHWSLLCRLR